MNRYGLTRRSFLTTLGALVTSLLAACSGPQDDPPDTTGILEANRSTDESFATPTTRPIGAATAVPVEATPFATASPAVTPTAPATPQPLMVRMWIDPSLTAGLKARSDAFRERLIRLAGQTRYQFRTTDARADADILIRAVRSVEGQAVLLGKEPLVPITPFRLPLSSITSEQLGRLLEGDLSDWSQVGSPRSIAVQPVSYAPSVDQSQTSPDQPTATSYDELLAVFQQHPGALALIPRSMADYRVNTLSLGDIDPLAHDGPPDDWPVHLYLVAESQSPDWKRELRALFEREAGQESDRTAGPRFTITMAGDVILGRTVHTIMDRLQDFAAPFRLVADELKRADLTIVDLECSLSDNVTPPSDPTTFLFMTYARGVEGLVLSGVDGVSQANNHSMNFGALGMRDTLATLDKAGIKHFGIGENLAEARKPSFFDVHGVRLAFLGYDGITAEIYGAGEASPGTAPLDPDMMVEDVAAAVGQAQIVVPYVHWGVEYMLTPGEAQRRLARRLIDAGATIVVGSHPHWVQGIELYKGRPIIYSLGNFVFDQEWSLETKQGLIMQLAFDHARLTRLRFVPVLIEEFHRPRIVVDQQFLQIIDRVWQSSDILAGSPLS